ncbi:MAG: alanine racemase [Myxococcaceae bacterium]
MKAIINLGALSRNVSKIQQLAGTQNIIAMVKANAYGHGLIPVGQFLESQGVKCFGVATVEEGEDLRAAGIQSKILLMSGAGICFAAERILKAHLTPLVSSIEELEILNNLGKKLAIHIDLDTGMSRGGFQVSNLNAAINWLTHEKHYLDLEGLCTHFANAEKPDCEFSKIQLREFTKAKEKFEAAGFRPSMVHVSKSSAITNRIGLPDAWVRPGIALYGGCEGFEPVMSLLAPVTLVKTLQAGQTVGYDQTWQASRETKIALLRAGYGDGYPRALSNTGPILGRVSMDLITLDATDLDLKVGDWVPLMSILEIARACQTIPYEILTRVAQRTQRLYR